MVQLICAVMSELTGESVADYTKLITFVKDRPGHDWRYAINCKKLETQLGWKRAHQLDDGIRKTAKWYLEKYINPTLCS